VYPVEFTLKQLNRAGDIKRVGGKK